MAGRKTSISLDEETLEILKRRAEAEQLDRSAYLARLIHRDDLRQRIAADSATLNAAGHTPDRATAVTAALIAQRRSAD
ncbi:ribbon-helix-helix protein, CopG family [Nocardia sp. NPDC050175]|uniref:ribbon-helix-helix protein, CopG family n=1 Tax=Nocardia sp. NPDC050175 TaxID=3364317 RepID=UPI0037879705